MFTRVCHWSLSWARWSQSTTSHTISLRSIPLLSTYLCLDLPNVLPFWFSNQNFLCISYLSHAWFVSHLSHPPWGDHPNNIWWSVQVMKLLIMQSVQPLTTSSLLGPNILLSNLFSNTLNLCSSLSVRDEVSYPYRTKGKIIVTL
jgi:hypothetical protein